MYLGEFKRWACSVKECVAQDEASTEDSGHGYPARWRQLRDTSNQTIDLCPAHAERFSRLLEGKAP